MGKRMIHMSLNVRGALKNWPNHMFKDMFTREDGHVLSVEEAKDYLMDELKAGHELIPLSSDCEDFDYNGGGCRGHVQDEEAA